MRRFEGKVAIVTGASRGIGRGIALRLADEGAKVVINHRGSADGAAAVAEEISARGGAALVIQADVSQYDEAQRLVQETLAAFGQVDVLVNNAGIAHDGALWRLTDAQWQAVLDTNVTGAFHCLAACAPHFRRQKYGKVVSISAHQAARPGFGVASYAASKAALEALTRSAAVELGPSNVNVNAVAPGFVHTERLDQLPVEVVDRTRKRAALGRLGEPEEIASVVAFLASEAARHITGQVLVVDGGLSLE